MSPVRDLAVVGLEVPSKLSVVLGRILPSTVYVRSVQCLEGHLHSHRLITLSNGARILLKSPPRPTTRLLRREQFLLGTEARVLRLLRQSAVSCVPSLLHYDPQDTILGSAAEDRRELDRQLGLLVNMIGQHTANSFGTLEQVALGSGARSWREAFLVHFESILRDSEDVFVHLPYAEIRHQVGRLSPVLDEITSPRLVICDFGRPSAVLLDPVSKQLAGIAGFDSALWGDVYMGEIFEDPSPAVLDGFASRDIDCEPDLIRQLLYTCYRSIHNITVQYYRERNSAAEIEARRRLTRVLTKMAAIEVVETRVAV